MDYSTWPAVFKGEVQPIPEDLEEPQRTTFRVKKVDGEWLIGEGIDPEWETKC